MTFVHRFRTVDESYLKDEGKTENQSRAKETQEEE